MALKDYYKILNVKPDASAIAIKQSYRRLAMKYHPDKNVDDALSAAVFADIAEAYSIIGDADERKQYNLSRYHTAVTEYSKPAETIESLIVKSTQLKKVVEYANPFHLNKDALLYSIQQLFPNPIELLLKTNKQKQIKFFETVLICVKWLLSSQIKILQQQMQPLFVEHEWLKNQLQALLKQQIKNERWEKYKIVLAILLAVILCVVILLATRK